MKALILNSGLGSRMGALTENHPKCMTTLTDHETILSRQLKQLVKMGIDEVVMTTGYYNEVLIDYCYSLQLPISYTFINNPLYDQTNYIYSIYCAREQLFNNDILLLHGDLVFDDAVLHSVLNSETSCMTVSSTLPLPEKDFKAVIHNGAISKVGIEYVEDALMAQPLYKLNKADWQIWLNEIVRFCESGHTNVYAEHALNEVAHLCTIVPLDIRNELCLEIDNPEDLAMITQKVNDEQVKTVYMCFSTDFIHSGHIAIIKKAAALGQLTIGVLSDEAVASYKRFPLMPFEERKSLISNIVGVHHVIEQKTLSYVDVLKKLKPTYVVHGDDWREGFQKPIRDEVVNCLVEYGGQLIEYPYTNNENLEEIEKRSRAQLAMPDFRRSRLKKLLNMKGFVNAIETHSGITGLIAEKTKVLKDGKTYQFDAMWVSSLCDSTAKGKPDIELVDMSSRFRTIDDIMEVTTKPIIFDGDTGGLTEHFVYNVKTLERMGVSMIIVEDKTGLKKNSLFGTEVEQTQDSIENFSEKIRAGKRAQKTKDFMICARIESLILEKGMEDALTRAFAYTEAGADAIMIHSRKKDPDEIFEFVEKFREKDKVTPIVVVPTSFNTVTEEEFKARGVNVVIYANQLTRTGFPAMQNAARTILEHRRAKECDDMCMSIKEIITLIPGGIGMKQTIIEGSYEALSDIINQLNIKKIMVVCGQSFKGLELSSYIDSLQVEKVYFTDFTPNPIYEDVCKGVSRFKLEQCDALIAIGGGSPIDVAKCIKLFSQLDESTNYLEQAFVTSSIPLIAIPTTAGSGSESTRFSVIYYNDVKQSVQHDSILPDYALLIPNVLASLPVYQKKCTALDALCQAIEAYWSVNSTDESKGYSIKAIQGIIEHINAYVFSNDAKAMEHIMLASNYAGRAINITLTTAPHAMSYKLTTIYGLPHGHSVAISLAEVWAYMLENPEKTSDKRGINYVKDVFQAIADAMSCSNAEEALAEYRRLLVELEIGLPASAHKDSDVEQLAASVNVERLNNNPIMLDHTAIKGLYERIVRDEA